MKVYDSAWLGYGNTLDAPAENVTFFNVGLLNSRLSALQERVNQLEKTAFSAAHPSCRCAKPELVFSASTVTSRSATDERLAYIDINLDRGFQPH